MEFSREEKDTLREWAKGQRRGVHRRTCPACSPTRRNSKSRCLTVTVEHDHIVMCCHHCGREGAAKLDMGKPSFVPPVVETFRKGAIKRLDKALGEASLAYLSSRGISEKTAQAFNLVGARAYFPELGREEEAVAFPYEKGHKFRSVKEKAFVCDQPLSSLFGQQEVDLVESPDLVICEGECLTEDAEVLTPSGWKSIRDVGVSDMVAQWDHGVVSWVRPVLKIEKEYSGELVRFQNSFVTTTVTPGHRMPGIDRRVRHGLSMGYRSSSLKVMTATERKTMSGRHHLLPRTGELCGTGIDLSEAQIAFCLAVSADASIKDVKNSGPKKGGGARHARFHFTKARKADRLRRILGELGIEYTETEHPSSPGKSYFGVPLPDWVPGRILPWSWVADADLSQRLFIIDEMVEWDGNRVRDRNQYEYSTKHMQNAEVIQAIAHTLGCVSTIMDRENGFGKWFKVSVLLGKSHSSYQSLRPTSFHYDGMVYCITVPSSFFLVREDRKIIVTGNCDPLAFYEAGILNATSVPNGSSSFTKTNPDGTMREQLGFLWGAKELIEKATRIVIATDADEPGDKLADELSRRIGRHRCWRVSYPDGCKDANDVLMKHGAAALAKAYEEARPWPIDGLFEAEKYFPEVDDLFDNGFAEKISTGLTDVDDIFSVSPGLLTVVTGIPGSGKSTFIDQIMVNLARQKEYVCAICSFENPPAVHIGKLMQMLYQKHFFQTDAIGPRMERKEVEAIKPFIHRHFKFLHQEDGKKATVESIIERIKTAVFRWGVQIVVIDPYNYIARPSNEESETSWIDNMLTELRLVASLYKLHIFFVAHPTKMPMDADGNYQVPKGYSISGSAAWFSKPDFGLTVHREPNTNAVRIVNWKTRYDWLGKVGEVKVIYDNLTHNYQCGDFTLAWDE